MRNFFRREQPVPIGFKPILSGESLLTSSRRAKYCASIRSKAGVTDRVWKGLYQPILENVADTMQQLPGSQYHHHSYEGGLLDHTLETVIVAASKRANIENPFAGNQDDMVRYREVFTYAVFACAACHDLGKVLLDRKLRLLDADLQTTQWQPYGPPLSEQAAYYQDSFIPSRDYHLHEPVALTLLPIYLPADGLNWIAESPEVWIWTLQNFLGTANPIHRIVREADSHSVRRNMGQNKDTHPTQTVSVQGRVPFQLPVMIRQLIDDGTITLNRPGAMGFVHNNLLYVVAKRFTPAIREAFDAADITGLPKNPSRLLDMLGEYQLAETDDDRVIRRVLFRSESWKNDQHLPMIALRIEEIFRPDEPRPMTWEGDVLFEDTDKLPLETPITDTPPPAEPASPPETVHTDQSVPDATEPCEPDLGREFFKWLKHCLTEKSLNTNTRDALIHVTGDGVALVTPAIFRLFGETVDAKEVTTIQKAVKSRKCFSKTDKAGFLFRYVIQGERKTSTLHCWVLDENTSKRFIQLINKPVNKHLIRA